MTLEPTDQFDVIVAEGLRGRAAHATVHGRGMGDVRRRIRRRRQRQMAVGLVPAMAGLGWAVTRPVADAPLTPSGEAGPCGETPTTWLGGELMTTTFPPPTWMESGTTWEPDSTATTITFDPDGNVVVPYTGPTAPPFTGQGTTTVPLVPGQTAGEQTYVVQEGDSLVRIAGTFAVTPEDIAAANAWVDGTARLIYPGDIIKIPAGGIVPFPTTTTTMLDSDGNPLMVGTTWVGDASTTTTSAPAEATTTTICEPGTMPSTSVVPVTTETGDSTTTTIRIPFGDLTSTHVQVANCSAQNGAAQMMSSVLAEVGFVLADPVNGTCDPKIDRSYVAYDEGVPGAEAVADTLARTLGGLTMEPGVLPIKVESAAWAEGSGVVLYLGNDLAGKTLDQIQGLPPDA